MMNQANKQLTQPETLPKRLRALVVGTITSWFEDRAASKGAALAYYTLFSLAPLLVIVIAIAGAVFGREAARGALFKELNGLVGPTGAEAIQLLLANARDTDTGLLAGAIAIGVLLVGATTAFGELKDSLDQIWQVPPVNKSGFMLFLRTRLLSVGLIMVLVFLLLVSLTISAALAMLQSYWGEYWSDLAYILQPVSSAVSFIIIASLFAAIYKLLPHIRLPWRDVLIGAIGTAALFLLGKNAIGAYLGNNALANTQGAAGSVIALLLWVYYSAQIFFLGAEFTRHYAILFGSLRNSPAHAHVHGR